MPLRDATAPELLGLMNHLTVAQRAVFETHTKLAVWLPDLDAASATLRSAPSFAEVQPEPDGGQKASLDRRAEASIRVFGHIIEAMIELYTAKNDAEGVRTWTTAKATLFPNGLAFLRGTVAGQTGETDRMLSRTTTDDDLRATLGAVAFLGSPLTDFFGLVKERNDALAGRVGPQGAGAGTATAGAARRAALGLITDILPIVERVLTNEPETRDRVLAPFRAIPATSGGAGPQ